MATEPQNLAEAFIKISELEAEIAELKKKLDHYESRDPGGRRKHDEKWQESYNKFVELYVAGESMAHIVEVSDFSRRTAYRYKEYFDQINKSNKNPGI